MAIAATNAHQGISHNAAECVKALELADFAAAQGLPCMATGLRKLAAFHADHAWRWVPQLQVGAA